jgi:cadmium resistance protein CadD (predicted permease)
MSHLGATLLTAVVVFVSTNVDDLVLVVALFAAASTGALRRWHVVAGQYLGFVVLVIISLLAGQGLTIVPTRWVGLLGLLPVLLGVRGLIKARHIDPDAGQVYSVDRVAAGAGRRRDHRQRRRQPHDLLAAVPHLHDGRHRDRDRDVVFAGVALRCAAGVLLSADKRVAKSMQRLSRWLVPLVFVTIGTTVLIRTGVLVRLVELL